MTYKQIQDRVMARLNLTSTEARNRIKEEINDRYREVQTSCNLEKTRFGTANITVTNNTATSTVTGVAKLVTVFDPTILKRPLGETSVAQIRARDAAAETTGTPTHFAIQKHVNDSITLMWWPKPDANNTLVADAVLAGTDLSADEDQPTIPVDYHDILVHGVMADEYLKMEMRPAADREESKFEKRLAELRYFLAKSAYLRRQQNDVFGFLGLHSYIWPYSNLGA